MLVWRDKISQFVLWTLAPVADIPLEMMWVAILRALCKPCCWNWSATPEVAICTENVVISALSAGILFHGERLEYPLEYFIQHLSVCLLLLIQPVLRINAFLDCNRQESDHHDAVRWGDLADLRRLDDNCHIYRPLFLVASKFREMCSVGHEDQGNQCIPHSEHWLTVN